jgi:phospholipid/cholesterol/gamma-HCH transport system ATP-binding protein
MRRGAQGQSDGGEAPTAVHSAPGDGRGAGDGSQTEPSDQTTEVRSDGESQQTEPRDQAAEARDDGGERTEARGQDDGERTEARGEDAGEDHDGGDTRDDAGDGGDGKQDSDEDDSFGPGGEDRSGREEDKDELLEQAQEFRDSQPDLPEGRDPSEHETAANSDVDPTHALPAQGNVEGSQSEKDGEGEEQEERSGSRVSVVDEEGERPDPPEGADEDEYEYHTYKVYPSGRPDAVEFVDVYKGFGRAKILRGLNMGLPEGMVSMILGPSGTGKSVCINHMVGLLYPDHGDVLVHGESVPNMADEDLYEMRKKFGLLFQDGALFGSMNVYDNVAFPLRQHTEKGEDEIEDVVMHRLGEVGLADAADKMPNELSGGMRKRAGFARALVLEPDIVLFDEPDSGLDPVRTALLGELILEIHRDMMDQAKEKEKEHLPTFAVITHDIMSARRVADYINVLWRGRVVEAGPAEDMLNSDNPFIRQFLSGESEGPLGMD